MSKQTGYLNDDMIKAHMRALSDFEEICADPYLEETKAFVRSTDAGNSSGDSILERNRKFVQESLSGNSISAEDFKDISIEIRQSDIDLLSVEWVNEWHRKKQAQATLSAVDEERRNFIAYSLSEAAPEEEKAQPKIRPYRRFAYMAAAAVIGIMIFISVLTPSSSPDKLFKEYYKSFPAMTSATRGNNASEQSYYNQAIEYYKAGKYAEASATFRLASQENAASFFYLGLSELENGNTDQAISALELAAEKQDTYSKDTKWYLGLAWLKKGNKAEASRCFSALAGNEGFYGKRAAKILRRLR